jgi:hypothetical protein
MTNSKRIVTNEKRQLGRSALAALLVLCLNGALLAPGAWAQSSGVHTVGDEADLESPDVALAELQKDVLEYQRAIEALEIADGPFAPGLSEQLLSLGFALQRNGDHLGAIEVFKRGVHLSRITEGLSSPRQLALLRGEIESHVAVGDLEAADERQRYLYWVQEQTLSDRSRGEALMRHALWQRQAYEAGLGEEPQQRLLRMWSLYRLALTEIMGAEGQNSAALLPPLYGMLQSQYLLTGFVGETTSGRFRSGYAAPNQGPQELSYRGSSFKQGAAIIKAIYDVRLGGPAPSLRDAAEPTVMLADWQLWHGKREEAFATYGGLERELAAKDDAQVLREELFATPRPLPALEGVRAFPDPAVEQDGMLLLTYGVTARGKVVDIERLDENPAIDAKANRIMRRLRQTLFRPRISDGMPVDTTGLVVAYDVSQW